MASDPTTTAAFADRVVLTIEIDGDSLKDVVNRLYDIAVRLDEDGRTLPVRWSVAITSSRRDCVTRLRGSNGGRPKVSDDPTETAAPKWPDPGWSRKCAYCGAASGTADVCCAECRQDIHAHCPSWPSCTRHDYGRPCDATR